ncbi:hypothetical protein CP913_33315 [Pseudomonas aeruginosa]|uniref:hypothetical protein n=1 Tax=Pseudomonas aeruginosa TaxID=287 RepID=UPI0010178D15|nr:hypothetical protein [Pseudomonas aeruginosa]QBA69443.1 hypothetical protein CP913_33315 [Pseudomonas aeruginosa]UFM90632.1 hypothetical protein LO758_06470 [Pseudomonas aeruginosa]UFM99227.1 hypothetical protein LO759_06470 [Pseudomonas aeruginosa]CAB5697509.1 Uncharacterised protein [Pseudomonas aeruginosa]
MCWIVGVDEIASETQVSEGWTYAVLPDVAVSAIDSAVSGCNVKAFHGKKFKKSQEADYEKFLSAARSELIKHDNSFLSFTLLDISWKNQFLDFSNRLVDGGIQGAGVNDPNALAIAKHLFPGLITFQRLAANANLAEISIEIDSDDISKKLAQSSLSIKGQSIPAAKLLGWAYEGHRKKQFPASPALGTGSIRALTDAKSRAIQVADVFGNFALSYIFIQLGHTSKTRKMKAEIFERVFSSEISPGPILSAAKLSGVTMNDIELTQPGGLTLRLG